MIIPKKILLVLENKKNFDYLFLEHLSKSSPKVAYEKAIDEMHKYAPEFKHYEDYNSYRSVLHRDYNGEVDVPEYIITAVTRGIDDLMTINQIKVGIRKVAYDMTVSQIQKYLPTYKPFKNYQSYRAMQSIRHKKKKDATKNK